MKTNLSLFLILVVMLVGVYIDQEVHEKAERKRELVERSLLKQTDFREFEFANGVLKKESNTWGHSNIAWAVDQKKMDLFVKLLHSIQIKHKLLDFNLDDYFQKVKKTIKIKGPSLESEFWVGDSIEATGRFYIYQVETEELFICEDTSVFDIPYSSDRDYGLKKYLRLASILEAGVNTFWQSNFLTGLGLKELKMIEIDSVRNRDLAIDFVANKTKPPAPSPLGYKNLKDTVESFFQRIRVKKVINKGQNFLSDQRSVIRIEANQNFNLNYHIGLNETYGKFIRIEGLDYIFEVEMEPRNIFFLTGNDFWVKRFHFEQGLSNLTELNFSLKTSDREWQDFTIFDLENFKIKSQAENVNFSKVHMNVIFNLLFNLADFKEASFVENLSENQLNEARALSIKLLGSELLIWVENDFIKVIDRKHRLLYHFSDAGDQIKAGFFRAAFTVAAN